MTNIFTPSMWFDPTIGTENFYEQRIENDANGNPLYVAWTPIANANQADTVWWIRKLSYDSNGFVSRIHLPLSGNKGFNYSWTLRATYF